MFDQKKLNKLIDKALSNYESLSKEERICYSIRVTLDSVNNGGLPSVYYNCAADNIYEIIEDFKIIEQYEIVKVIEEANKLFPNEKVPSSVEERNKIIDSWEYDDYSDELCNRADEIFYRADEVFYQKEEILENIYEKLMNDISF